MTNRWLVSGGALLVVAAGIASVVSAASAVEKPVSFAADVLPILKTRCVECHAPGGDGYEASGLDLRDYAGLMKGTKYGPIVIPGDPLVSNLNVVVEGRAAPEIRMPHHRNPLFSRETLILRRWVEDGAKDN